MDTEVVRKLLHVLLAVAMAFFAPHLLAKGVIFVSIVLCLFFLLIRISRVRLFGVQKLFRASYGELFFCLGMFITARIAFPQVEVFQLSALVLGFSDASAFFIGTMFGKHAYSFMGERRSLEGTCACAITTFVLCGIFGISFLYALMSALIVSAVEVVSLRGSDNTSIPVAMALLASLWW